MLGTLDDIRLKIRRLTGRTRFEDISNEDLDEYIDTFCTFDFPENLRLFSNTTQFEFITEANVSTYDMNSKDPAKPAYNELTVDFNGAPEAAVNVYYNLGPPFIVSGAHGLYIQSLHEFRPIASLSRNEFKINGNDEKAYSFYLPHVPVLQNTFAFGAIDETGSTVKVTDVPYNREFGDLKIINNPNKTLGTINYLTGSVDVTFENNIPVQQSIDISYSAYKASRPTAMLFFQNQITLSPVPDKAYKIEINAFITPTKMLSSSEYPTLKQWWQYIAYGATKKIFEDSRDIESVSRIMPAFKEQENLVLNRHVVQQTNERTPTIYSHLTESKYSRRSNNVGFY